MSTTTIALLLGADVVATIAVVGYLVRALLRRRRALRDYRQAEGVPALEQEPFLGTAVDDDRLDSATLEPVAAGSWTTRIWAGSQDDGDAGGWPSGDWADERGGGADADPDEPATLEVLLNLPGTIPTQTVLPRQPFVPPLRSGRLAARTAGKGTRERALLR